MLVTLEHFDPFQIARSGQCFRMTAQSGGVEALAGARRVLIRDLGAGQFEFDCAPGEYETFWKGYFDLDTDYGAIWRSALERDAVLARAAALYPGIRILRQEPWETLCSFLLSQRKSIPAIRTCVEALCRAYGAEQRGYFAFPAPEALLAAGETGLRACGAGYRAPYLLDAARLTASGALPLREMADWPRERLEQALRGVKGVGVKVAACVMLFAYHRLDVCPVDVWIHRIITGDFGGASPFDGYGPLAGVYQQYLFLERMERDRGPGRRAASRPSMDAPQ